MRGGNKLSTEVYPFRRVKKEPGRKAPKEKKGRAGARQKSAEPGTGHIFGGQEKEARTKEKRKTSRLFPLVGRQVALVAAGFFLGRAVLFGELVPFAPAFTAASAWVFPAAGIPVAAGVAGGLLSCGKNVFTGLISVFLSLFLPLGLSGRSLPNPVLVLSGLVFTVSLLAKSTFLAFSEALPYDYIAALFEAVLGGVCTLIFLYALASFRKMDGVQNLKAEELFCLFVFFTAVVAGTTGLKAGEITLQGFVSRLLILTAALIGGIGQGAAAGALMGMVPALVPGGVPVMMGVYSFAGLLAGAGRSLGKPGVAMGFLLGNIMLALYLQNFSHLAALVTETGLSILFFFLLPANFVQKVTSSLAVLQLVPRENKKIQAILAGKMRKWSHFFQELSQGYAAASTAFSDPREEPALQGLFNEIENKVCHGCGLFRTCWEREFYRTYQSFLDLFTLVEIYGQVTQDDLPEIFKRRCTRAKELAITVTCLYDTYKLNRYWRRKFTESKEIFSEQLKNISEMIEGLTQQLPLEIEGSSQKEGFLKEKLKQAGIPVVEVKIYQQEEGRVEISLKREPCADRQECPDRLSFLLSQVTEQQLSLPNLNCTGVKEGLCHLRLYPALKYQVRIGLAKTCKEGNLVSGDSHSFLPLRNGKFAFLLSDGMGTGPQAALQSGTALSLLEHLLEMGLGLELAIKTVNSLLMLRSTKECFATIDLVVVDLYTGQAEFIKIGAPPGLLARGRRVTQINASSLPAGIIKDIEVYCVTRNLAKGDLLVIFSDGLLETYQGPREKEEWAKEVLQEASSLTPQEIAEVFLQLALANSGGSGRVADDITIMAARLEEKKPFP
ncbi:MAG: stage II sporulation protein E [Desulfotomaculales bacterium]